MRTLSAFLMCLAGASVGAQSGAPRPTDAQAAQRFAAQADSLRQALRRSPHVGGSGLFTSIEVLARWDRTLDTHQLGGPELTALLHSRMRFAHSKDNDAFGVVWGTHRSPRTLWYEGGDLGYRSYMVRLPDLGTTTNATLRG